MEPHEHPVPADQTGGPTRQPAFDKVPAPQPEASNTRLTITEVEAAIERALAKLNREADRIDGNSPASPEKSLLGLTRAEIEAEKQAIIYEIEQSRRPEPATARLHDAVSRNQVIGWTLLILLVASAGWFLFYLFLPWLRGLLIAIRALIAA